MYRLRFFQVVLSYALLLVGYMYFDWNPFMFFFTFLLEIIVLLIIYAVLRIKDESSNSGKYRKSQPLMNVIIGSIPLIGFQFFFIFVTAGILSVESDNKSSTSLLGLLTGAGMLTISYLLTLSTLKQEEKAVVFRDHFLFKCLALTATTIVALSLIIAFGIWSKWRILTGVLIVRFLIEWRYFKILPNSPLSS